MSKQTGVEAPMIKCRYDKLVDPKKLKPYPRNRNAHTKDQIERLAKLLKYQGIRAPIVLSSLSKCIVKGHGTRLAIMENKWDKCPVVIQKFDDEDQEYAFVQSDNAIAEWASLDLSLINADLEHIGSEKFDLDMLGIKDFELEPADKYADKDADAVPETKQNELGVRLGDIYQLGEHRLMCGDSTDLEAVKTLMDGKKADLWLTDPPYGVGMEAREKSSSSWVNKSRVQGAKIENDDLPMDQLQDFWFKAAEAAYSVTSDKASYYWFACQGGDQMMMMMSISRAKWKLRHEIIWAKDQMVFGRCDYHYKHEPIFYGWKQKGSHEWFGDRKQTSMLEIPRPKSSDLHPTMKPVELLDILIKNNTKQNMNVLDTFGGSGSTLIACEKASRKAYVMELDPHYVSVIIKRFEKFSGKKAIKRHGNG